MRLQLIVASFAAASLALAGCTADTSDPSSQEGEVQSASVAGAKGPMNSATTLQRPGEAVGTFDPANTSLQRPSNNPAAVTIDQADPNMNNDEGELRDPYLHRR
jgi:hypothetical protein